MQVPFQNVQRIGTNTHTHTYTHFCGLICYQSAWASSHQYIKHYESPLPQTIMTLAVFRCPSNIWSPLSVCLFNMQRWSFRESFWSSVNESAAMISWCCRGSVHHVCQCSWRASLYSPLCSPPWFSFSFVKDSL